MLELYHNVVTSFNFNLFHMCFQHVVWGKIEIMAVIKIENDTILFGK